jgi:calcium-dependent protein kinase
MGSKNYKSVRQPNIPRPENKIFLLENKNTSNCISSTMSEESDREKMEIQKIKIDSDIIVFNSSEDPRNNFEFLTKLGQGLYGEVWKVRNKINGNICAMKIIFKHKDTSKLEEMEILNEIEIMKRLDHPNIVKIFEYYNTKKAFYLIMEYCSGGELYYEIINRAPFNEETSSYIIYQVMSVVFYCHSNYVVHRDLKPENILIENKKDGLIRIKICDFGTAKIYEKNKTERQIVGSSYYIAPEVLDKNYNKECDLWSIGVIFYILLAGRPPFQGVTDQEVIDKIKLGKLDLQKPPFEKISEEALNLLKALLQYKPENRITSSDALKHPFFSKYKSREVVNNLFKLNDPLQEQILKAYIKNIIDFKKENILQKAIIAYLVHNFPQMEEIENAFKLFDKFDLNGDGKINRKELLAGLRSFTSISFEELEKNVEAIFNFIDSNNNGFIEYEEFVCAAIDKKIFLKDEVIKFAFSYVDKNHNGRIEINDIRNIFKKEEILDNDLEKQINIIFDKFDLNHNGIIDYEEFKYMMCEILS